jgi:methylated-DNA-[protein]-cysteine S-methyltransferase
MTKQLVCFEWKLATPFGSLGITLQGTAVTGVSFSPAETSVIEMRDNTPIAKEFAAYFKNPTHQFNLTVNADGTDFQKRVWHALTEIPCGTTLTYGELAKKLHSSPRAVGQACRKNPTPIIVPCHRVVGADDLGGFAGETEGNLPAIKQWLLRHEMAYLPCPA